MSVFFLEGLRPGPLNKKIKEAAMNDLGKVLLAGAAIAGGLYAASKLIGDDGMSSITEAVEEVTDAIVDGTIDPDDLFDDFVDSVDGVGSLDLGFGSIL